MTGWFLLFSGVALKSILLLGAAGVAAILMRRQSAATRHVVWMAAFTALLALPLLTASLPGLYAPVTPESVFQATAPLRLGAEASEPRAPASGPTSGQPAESRRRPRRATPLVFWAWFAGTGVSLAQMALAWLAAVRIRRKARPFRGISIDRVPVLETKPGAMPMTFGLLRPAIFLPSDAAEWTAERRRLVVSHELAHIQRGDAATHLLARFALSLYWWNPLAWLAWRQFVRERERAADDMVLRSGVRASDYAGHLVEIARAIEASAAFGWAAVAMSHRSQLESRVRAILDTRINRRAPRRAAGWVAALAAIVLIAPLAALRAQDTQTVPADVDATIRAAAAQKNHEMLDGAARAAEAYRQYDLARKLLESSLAIRAEVSGQGSVDYGVGLVKLGDLERDRKNFTGAEAFYTKAASVLAGRPESAQALIDLGLLAMRPDQMGQLGIHTVAFPKDPQKAFDYFSQSQAADPAKPGRSLMWMAVAREQLKDIEGAERLFKQALDASDPGSSEVATSLQVYAGFLQRQGRTEEAASIKAKESRIRTQLALSNATEYRRAAGPAPLRVGAGVAAPTLVSKVEPEYSEEARAAKYQGTVVVTVTIDTDGTAQDMKIVRGLGLGLDEKALQAISQWKFKPGAREGQPVPVMATIEVNFRLL
jgi:TonB family protein